MPRAVETHLESRLCEQLFSNSNATLIFASMRVVSVRPQNGPSTGGTLISLIGTGFTDTGRQSVKFVFGENLQFCMEVSCSFDPATDCFYCNTPSFEDASEENLKWPLKAQLLLTLDGEHYYPADQPFLVYSSKI